MRRGQAGQIAIESVVSSCLDLWRGLTGRQFPSVHLNRPLGLPFVRTLIALHSRMGGRAGASQLGAGAILKFQVLNCSALSADCLVTPALCPPLLSSRLSRMLACSPADAWHLVPGTPHLKPNTRHLTPALSPPTTHQTPDTWNLQPGTCSSSPTTYDVPPTVYHLPPTNHLYFQQHSHFQRLSTCFFIHIPASPPLFSQRSFVFNNIPALLRHFLKLLGFLPSSSKKTSRPWPQYVQRVLTMFSPS